MSKLYFKRADVLKVVEDAKKATLDQRRATFGQYLNGGAYGDKGLDPVEGGIERVNNSLKPELHLVHDEGIYLMPNALFKGISIAYARGCNPKTDGDVWDHCRDLVGSDDFSENLPINVFENFLKLGASQIIVDFEPRQIHFGYIKPKAEVATLKTLK